MPDSPAKILIIDDNPENLRVAAALLESQDFAVRTARDGERGILRAQSARPDLILLDVQMPGIDGYETCRRLKVDPSLSDIPVIFMTALTEVADKTRAFEAGGVDYVPKPFEAAELLARIGTHLSLARLQQELQAHNALLEERVTERTRALMETNTALSRFVPAAFLRSLGHSDILGAQLGDHVHRQYTVMFSDIRGYTALAEALGPEAIFGLLKDYSSRMGPIITAHGGYVCHYLGDGLLAIFPTAEGAAAAAIAQQLALDALNSERAAEGAATIRVGIGLNTGILTLGVLGDGQRLDVSIIGDAVNLAARVEGLTKNYGVRVAISDTTRAGLDADARLRLLDRVLVQGKREPTVIYELLEADPPELRARKQSVLAVYVDGQRAADAGDFAAASKAFIDVLQTLPEDVTARLWLERVARFLLQGRPAGWIYEPPK